LPIHLEEPESRRRSETANLEYQNVRPSAMAGGGASPGLITRARTIMPTTKRIPTSVAGSAMLELEALLADGSGAEADCEPLPPDPFPGAVPGMAAFPELGTSGVTLVGAVVLGPATFWVPAMAAWVVSPAD
jgi:hypothetical protein